MALRRALLALAGALLAAACGTSVDLGGPVGGDSGGPPDAPARDCPGYAAPSTPAKCTACTYACQPNGCYNDYYCRLATLDCQPPRAACGALDGGGAGGHDL